MKSSAIKNIERKTKANTPLSHYQLAELIELYPKKALQKLELLVKKNPKDVELWVMSGRAHKHLQKFTSAERFYAKALELNPHDSRALYYKAELMYLQEQYEGVEYLIDNVIPYLEVDEAIPLKVLLAFSLQKQKKYQESIKEFSKLISLNEREWSYWNELGIIYQEIGQFDEMHKAYQQAKLLSEHSPIPYFNHIVGTHYDPIATQKDIMKLCMDWQDKFHLIPGHQYNHSNIRKIKNKRLRIGLISDGFRIHPVGLMIVRALSSISPLDLEFFAYSSSSSSDHITQRIQRIVKNWMIIENVSDKDLLETLHSDDIDILFDLSGYNANSRMQALQYKPAPIMVKWVGGLISSTGLKGMDYLISDCIETPDGFEKDYTEKLIRMPVDYICYDPPAYLPEIKSLPFRENNYITFGCFNNASKINDVLVFQWSSILKEVNNSKIYLKSFNYNSDFLCEKIWSKFERFGITRERVILEGGSPHKALLDSYNKVDIALDTWPYSGGLTTCEAMAMGVPVITLPGPTFAGRHSASHLVHAGLMELVADDWEGYGKIAIGLANDIPNLDVIRKNLRNVLFNSKVCDGDSFSRYFSNAMRAIWQRYCDDENPEHLYFNVDGSLYFADSCQTVHLEHPECINTTIINDDTITFDFKMNSQVSMMDYGGCFTLSEKFQSLMAVRRTFAIIMDPLGIIEDKHLPENRNSLQKIQLHLIGDGEDTQINMCLGPEFSSDLIGITKKENNDAFYPQKVLASIKVPSSKLDEIPGLEYLDWLIIDNTFDLKKLFLYGSYILSQCLVVTVYFRLNVTHYGQMTFNEVFHQLKSYGIELMGIFGSKGDISIDDEGVIKSSLIETDKLVAVFSLSEERINDCSENQREKAAFILHSAYDLHEKTYGILSSSSKDRGMKYSEFISRNVNQNSNVIESGDIYIPDRPHMTDNEILLFEKFLKTATNYFEFGSGGSTKLAVRNNIIVHGVESDPVWVEALCKQTGGLCKVCYIDIGPTREWGFPVDDKHRHKFPLYSESILAYKKPFDFILVDGRFRVACVLNTIKHIYKKNRGDIKSKIFIHDFWNRTDYHVVLDFLDVIEQVDTAGLFIVKKKIDTDKLNMMIAHYQYIPI